MFNLFRKTPANANVKQDDAQTFRVRVRTVRHGEIVEFRFTKGAHIGIDDDGNYVFRKPVISPQYLDRGELVVQFNNRYRVLSTSGDGVEFVPVNEWED